MNANDLLADMKAKLDEHFGLAHNPVKPEVRVTDETAKRFVSLLKDDDRMDKLDERIGRIERALGLHG